MTTSWNYHELELMASLVYVFWADFLCALWTYLCLICLSPVPVRAWLKNTDRSIEPSSSEHYTALVAKQVCNRHLGADRHPFVRRGCRDPFKERHVKSRIMRVVSDLNSLAPSWIRHWLEGQAVHCSDRTWFSSCSANLLIATNEPSHVTEVSPRLDMRLSTVVWS